MVTSGDKSKSVLTNLRFCQTAVTPSPSVSCFQTFQRVLIQNNHTSSQTTQKGEDCVLSLIPCALQAGSPWLWRCRQVTQALLLSHLWAEAVLGPGGGKDGPGSHAGSTAVLAGALWAVQRPRERVWGRKGGGFTIPYHTHFMELQWLDSQSSSPLLTDAL